MSDLSMLINGLKVTAEKNATFERRNPLDGTVATRAPAASPVDAVMAVRPRQACGPGARLAGSCRICCSRPPKLEKPPQFAEAVAARRGSLLWAV
jgi:benzaldehyde dehydrogenase (NAD)